MINVSADNRYKLFVNEKQVSLGPARGDLDHWNFAILNIAPFLHAGENIIAAQVWNEGEWRPEGQISFRTGFILQGNSENEVKLFTDSTWKCVRDISYHPVRFVTPTYYVAGSGEQIDMKDHPADWKKIDFPDGHWKSAQIDHAGYSQKSDRWLWNSKRMAADSFHHSSHGTDKTTTLKTEYGGSCADTCGIPGNQSNI